MSEATTQRGPTRTPPEMDYSFQLDRLKIGTPADDLTQTELFKWIAHIQSVSLRLRELQVHLVKRERAFESRKFKWANVIRGLKRTVMWQATVLEQQGFPEIQKKLKELLRWVPEFESKEVQKDRKAVGATERYPFFTEAYLYNTIGKEDARTLLSLVGQVAESVGLDRDDLQGEDDEGVQDVYDELEAEMKRGND